MRSSPCVAEADREPAQLGGQRQERAEQLHLLGRHLGDVDRVGDELAPQRGRDLLGDDHARPVLRLLRGRAQVRA